MQAALENFAAIKAEHKMVILGDMKELGTVSREAHQQIAAQALQSGVQTAWFVGDEFRQALGTLSVPQGVNVRLFGDVDEVKEAIAAQPPHGWLILIKGSNSTRLHQLPETL